MQNLTRETTPLLLTNINMYIDRTHDQPDLWKGQQRIPLYIRMHI